MSLSFPRTTKLGTVEKKDLSVTNDDQLLFVYGVLLPGVAVDHDDFLSKPKALEKINAQLVKPVAHTADATTLFWNATGIIMKDEQPQISQVKGKLFKVPANSLNDKLDPQMKGYYRVLKRVEFLHEGKAKRIDAWVYVSTNSSESIHGIIKLKGGDYASSINKIISAIKNK